MTSHRLAVLVSRIEGKKVQVNLAQIKEVLSALEYVIAQEAYDHLERGVYDLETLSVIEMGTQKKLDRMWKKHK